MIPIQLGGLLDSSIFGLPAAAVIAVGGLVALVAGALLRVQLEGVRRSRSGTEGSVHVTADGASPQPTGAGPTDRGTETSRGPLVSGREAVEPAGTAGAVDEGQNVTGPAGAGQYADAPPREEWLDGLPDLLRTAAIRFADEEYDGTIQAVYMFVRRRLADEHGVSTNGTHWDFYGRCADAGLNEGEDALRELTEVYEQAAFGSRPATESEAERAMELSGELTDVVVPDVT